MGEEVRVTTGKILVVDDEPEMRKQLEDILGEEGFDVVTASSGKQGLQSLDESVSMVIADVKMPGMNGIEMVREVKKRRPGVAVVFITAYGTMNLAVEAMKAGGSDFIAKPFEADLFVHQVRKILEHAHVVEENIRLRRELSKRFDISEIVGESPQIKDVIELVRKVAPTPSSVLIEGQSGTGKELVAKALHYLSDRVDKPFVTVNCAAIPDTLLESELFGHTRGAFTDAVSDKKGRFEEANRGTIFLDEIGDMSLSLQSKILRVLQEKEFVKVGGTKSLRVDVRVITATNKDLWNEFEHGRFRDDLYYRVNVINIKLPSLIERGEDVLILARHFIERFNHLIGRKIRGLSPEAERILRRHSWPGNVRELENVVERAVIFTKGNIIGEDVIAENLLRVKPDEGTMDWFLHKHPRYKEAVEGFERLLIVRALERAGGRLSSAAKGLGMSRHSLRYRVNKLGLEVAEADGETSDA